MKTMSLAVLLVCSTLALVQELPNQRVRFAAEPGEELFDAIGRGDTEKVKKLLDANPKLALHKKDQGYTPLHSAAQGRNVEIVKLLLDAKAEINAKAGTDEHTPLYLAAVGGSKDVVALLLDRGADVHAVTKHDRFTPLHRAAQRGRVEIITLLLDKGAKVDGGWQPKAFEPPITPLQFAVRERHLDAARLLLARGATVDASHLGIGNTPIYDAVDQGDTEMVKLLLRKGANPKQENPLFGALASGKMELIQLFIDRGADLKTDPRLLMYAAISGKKQMVELVLSKGFNIADAENRGISALAYASQNGHLDIVRLLLEKGVDPNLIGTAFNSPLAVAASPEIAELLIKHKAKVNEPDRHGITPMLAAVLRGNRPLAELLESHGAKHTLETLAALGRDIELKERLKKEPLPKVVPKPKEKEKEKRSERPTPLHHAVRFGELQTARVLIEAGADVNANITGFGHVTGTPLHVAAGRGHLPLVELLVEHKADVNAKMSEPAYSFRVQATITPLILALDGGHVDVVRFLAKAGGLPAIDGAKNATALLPAAAQRKHLALVKLLIEQGAPADTKLPPNNGTALHLAAEMGDLDMVKWLIARKLDVKTPDQRGWTPNMRAVDAGRTEVVKFLLSKGAKIIDTDLLRAATNGHVAMVELLLANGADRDAVSVGYDQYTALGLAAGAGKLDVVKFLHDKGASVKKDVGILHAAAFRGHRDVVAFLLDRGVDVEQSRPDGFSLYYWGFDPRRMPVLALFAEKDPAKFIKGQNSVTIEEIHDKPFVFVGGRPLQAAVAGRQKVIAEMLLKKGASPKVLFPDGSTLLHVAVMLGDKEMAELLLKHGAVDARNQKGQTALALAIEREEDELAELLRKHAAKP